MGTARSGQPVEVRSMEGLGLAVDLGFILLLLQVREQESHEYEDAGTDNEQEVR